MKWNAPFSTEDWVVIHGFEAVGDKEPEKLSRENTKRRGTGK